MTWKDSRLTIQVSFQLIADENASQFSHASAGALLVALIKFLTCPSRSDTKSEKEPPSSSEEFIGRYQFRFPLL